MAHKNPKDVKSPRNKWTLLVVLHDGGEGNDALAVGEWEGNRVLGARWNGNEESPVGNPQSRGIATWFVLPERYNEALLATLPENKQMIARALFEIA